MSVGISGVDEFYSRIGLTAPARSILYALEPMGVGTPMVECLTSYLSRLAKAHQVSVGTLVRFIISKSQWNTLMGINIQNLNGMGSSEYITESLEVLTCRNDIRYLSTLHWRGRITKGYLKKQKTWCPLCFQEWRESGEIIYEPLIWNIHPITICYQHQVPLHTECPVCHKTNKVIDNKGELGICSQCSSFLGFYLDKDPSQVSTYQLSWLGAVTNIIGSERAKAFLESQRYYNITSSPGLVFEISSNSNLVFKNLKLGVETMYQPPTFNLDRLILRRPTESDIQDQIECGSNKEIVRMYGGDTRSVKPLNSAIGKPWHDPVMKDPLEWSVEYNGKCIGQVWLAVDLEKRSARYAVGIFNPEYLNIGFGKEITNAILQYSFETLNLHRVDLRVLEYNKRAIACYKKCGFVREGVEREGTLIEDKFESVWLMGILEHEYVPKG